ncbi:STAS domain-containing protein [Metabacillus malikii]|uniref:Anti-anti-sigma regulatory factor n=1 Tax=Metabacillus malikii TaxID=1504265 RepID=A0ABT9ZIC0_9BACI|nr:STAS domain-containing protein [Metabacillus malikii]MDQ0232034.1 anti-anti-sigma regulatory factor [Metabacillus malikii]
MEFNFQNSYELRDFIVVNKELFKKSLLTEAVNVKDSIDEILRIGNIDLISNAQKLVIDIIEGNEKELQSFAKHEGIAWATHSIEITFKLEWIQAIRRTIWKFIEKYNELANDSYSLEELFILEKQINNFVDQFLNTFFISYSTYKDKLILAQKQLVENLSVPIIPISPSVCILPLIGSIDSFRTMILEEKILSEIGQLRIETLILDLSGIGDIDADVISRLSHIIDGTALMGCETVITGLRAEVVRKMISIGVTFFNKTRTLGTLQHALNEYFVR